MHWCFFNARKRKNSETTKRQTGSEKLPDTGKAAQPIPDYFRVIVTGIRIPAGSVGYRVPSALYDGTRLSMMLWQDQLVSIQRMIQNRILRQKN